MLLPDREIIPLTSLRGVAALWVVSFHLISNLAQSGYLVQPTGMVANLVGGGEFAVDLFFVLSGYVLALSSPPNIEYGEFLRRRIARVFPLHIFVLGSMTIGIIVMMKAGVTTKDANYYSFAALPAHFTLTWAWLGMPLGWNSPTWSLSVEFAGYLVFPLALAALRRMKRSTQTVLLCLMILGQVAVLTTMHYPSTGGLAVLRGLFGLGVGALLYLVFTNRPVPGSAAAALFVLVGLAFGQPPLTVPSVAYLILALSHTRSGPTERIMTLSAMAWLGRVSFSIYLIHVPMLIVFLQILRHVSRLQTPIGLLVFVLTYISAVLFVSGLTWRAIERPGQRVTRAIFARGTA